MLQCAYFWLEFFSPSFRHLHFLSCVVFPLLFHSCRSIIDYRAALPPLQLIFFVFKERSRVMSRHPSSPPSKSENFRIASQSHNQHKFGEYVHSAMALIRGPRLQYSPLARLTRSFPESAPRAEILHSDYQPLLGGRYEIWGYVVSEKRARDVFPVGGRDFGIRARNAPSSTQNKYSAPDSNRLWSREKEGTTSNCTLSGISYLATTLDAALHSRLGWL